MTRRSFTPSTQEELTIQIGAKNTNDVDQIGSRPLRYKDIPLILLAFAVAVFFNMASGQSFNR